MTKKEYLDRARMLDIRIEGKFHEADRLRRKLDGLCASRTEASETLEALLRLEDEINDEIDLLVEMKRQIRRAIDSVRDERLRTVLELRYLAGMQWDQISWRMRYDRVNLWRMHARALEEVRLPS